MKIDSHMKREDAFRGVNPLCPQHVIDNLELITVRYWGADYDIHQGQVVMARDLASDIREVFEIALRAKFPIYSVVPISCSRFVNRDGVWDDDLSMLANNSSGFNFRFITGTTKLSNHSLGRAIDINPFWNPYIRPTGNVHIPCGSYYDANQPGTLTGKDPVSKAFYDRGWSWGGNWTSCKDYQHFEKND